jgi:hypothetical protein
MSHSLSDRRRRAREHDHAFEERRRAEEALRKVIAFAGRIVDLWNARLARGNVLHPEHRRRDRGGHAADASTATHRFCFHCTSVGCGDTFSRPMRIRE